MACATGKEWLWFSLQRMEVRQADERRTHEGKAAGLRPGTPLWVHLDAVQHGGCATGLGALPWVRCVWREGCLYGAPVALPPPLFIVPPPWVIILRFFWESVLPPVFLPWGFARWPLPRVCNSHTYMEPHHPQPVSIFCEVRRSSCCGIKQLDRLFRRGSNGSPLVRAGWAVAPARGG